MNKKISLILAHPPHSPNPSTEKIIHLRIILWILVQSYTVNDLILFRVHCDLHIIVQRFCLVSLTISNRKASYRSLKQTAGSTVCPWTTILVILAILDKSLHMVLGNGGSAETGWKLGILIFNSLVIQQ